MTGELQRSTVLADRAGGRIGYTGRRGGLDFDGDLDDGSGKAGEVLDDLFGQRIDVAADAGGIDLHVSKEVIGLLRGGLRRDRRCATR